MQAMTEPTAQEQTGQQLAMTVEEEQAQQPGVPMSPESGSSATSSDGKNSATASPGTARSILKKKQNGGSPGTDRHHLQIQFQQLEIGKKKENKDPVAHFYHACKYNNIKDVVRLMSENNFSYDILQIGAVKAEHSPYVKCYLSNIIQAFDEHALFEAITAKNVRLERQVADLEHQLEALRKEAKKNSCVLL